MTYTTLKIKYGSPKTHKIGLKISQQSMQDGDSLEDQNGHRASQGERGSPPSDLEA